jgi:hypothetical protein
MRTTLDIDDDVLSAAKDLARADGKTVGEVLSELARKALTTPELPGLAEPGQQSPLSSWPTFPRRGGAIVTTEMVERIQEELDMEDAMPKDFTLDDCSEKLRPRPSKRPSGRGRMRRKKSPK